MKKPALMLLVLLLLAGTAVGLYARQEPAAVQTLANVMAAPTAMPTAEPTKAPTAEPTAEPTPEPTETPAAAPPAEPTGVPNAEPTPEPTETPTAAPTAEPAEEPTAEPTLLPTEASTVAPTPEAVGAEMSLTVQGFGGDVTVHVLLDEHGAIAELTADVACESKGTGRKCGEERWLEQFLGQTGPFALAQEALPGQTPIDAVSYATITSRAIIDAVNSLLMTE